MAWFWLLARGLAAIVSIRMKGLWEMVIVSRPRFKIGQQFKSSGKQPKLCTIVDVLRTYNTRCDLVEVRYIATHEFCGQLVRDSNVHDIEIAKGLVTGN
jgi:hypothetical protein